MALFASLNYFLIWAFLQCMFITWKVVFSPGPVGQRKRRFHVPSMVFYTVKRVDEVVRHRHLVTQDQNTQVSKKVFDIPTENFTINIELFRHFSQVSNFFDRGWIFQEQHASPGLELAIFTSTIFYSTTAPHFLPCLKVHWRIERFSLLYV